MDDPVEMLHLQPRHNVDDYIAQARMVADNGCYAGSFDLYLTAVEKWPHIQQRIEVEFRDLLECFNEYLINTGRKIDIFYNFERAIAAFPHSALLLNDIGKYLFKFQFLQEAIPYLYQALDLDTGLVSAEQNLNSIKNYFVPRWHYRMLNDKIRNTAFKQALHEIVVPNVERVMDIGTGTGLLSLFARECKPGSVFACEGSKMMADIANYVFKENKMTNFLFINKNSTELTTYNTKGRQTVVVTEVFDAGLLGEKVLETLEHGWENLFVKDATIIPARAEFFVVGVQCDKLSHHYRLADSALEVIGLPKQDVRVCTEEPYDAEDISFFKQLEYITEPQSVLKIKFSSLEDIKEKIYNYNNSVNIPVIKNGKVNCIIGYFDLHLTDNIMLTTNPRNENKAMAWQQAVFHDFKEKIVNSGDILSYNFTTDEGKVALMNNDENVDRVSESLLRFLNDANNVRAMEDAINVAMVYLDQFDEPEYLSIVDLNPFPIIGLQLLKRGINKLTCMAKNYHDKKFIKKVFEQNDIQKKRLKIVMEEDVTAESFKGQTFHLVVTNLLHLSGDVNVKQKEILKKLIQSNLVDNGMVIPHKILLEAQLVYSDFLEKNNMLYDENICGYNISSFINKFQVSQNFHLDLTNIEYTEMSKVVEIGDYFDDIEDRAFPVEIIREGKVNNTLLWYKIQYIEGYEPISTKRVNSFINATAFRSYPLLEVTKESETHILRCVDEDQAIKLLTHVQGPDE